MVATKFMTSLVVAVVSFHPVFMLQGCFCCVSERSQQRVCEVGCCNLLVRAVHLSCDMIGQSADNMTGQSVDDLIGRSAEDVIGQCAESHDHVWLCLAYELRSTDDIDGSNMQMILSHRCIFLIHIIIIVIYYILFTPISKGSRGLKTKKG